MSPESRRFAVTTQHMIIPLGWYLSFGQKKVEVQAISEHVSGFTSKHFPEAPKTIEQAISLLASKMGALPDGSIRVSFTNSGLVQVDLKDIPPFLTISYGTKKDPLEMPWIYNFEESQPPLKPNRRHSLDLVTGALLISTLDVVELADVNYRTIVVTET